MLAFIATLGIVIFVSHVYPCVLAAYEDTLDWTTFISDECKMSMTYPTSFEVEEIANEFESNVDLVINSEESYKSVMVECNDLDMTFLKYDLSKDSSRLHEKLLGYDDFMVEDINITMEYRWTK